jgi:hypothetical protein
MCYADADRRFSRLRQRGTFWPTCQARSLSSSSGPSKRGDCAWKLRSMMGLRDTMIRGLKALAVCLPCDGSRDPQAKSLSRDGVFARRRLYVPARVHRAAGRAGRASNITCAGCMDSRRSRDDVIGCMRVYCRDCHRAESSPPEGMRSQVRLAHA